MVKKIEDKTIYLLKIWLVILTVLCAVMLYLIIDNMSSTNLLWDINAKQEITLTERCCSEVKECPLEYECCDINEVLYWNLPCPEDQKCINHKCVPSS
jgi:hypothetical protein